MKETQGRVAQILPGGRVLIETVIPDDTDDKVRVFWSDREEISAEQRKKIFAIVEEIAIWAGYGKETERVRKNLTADFLRQNIQRLQMSAVSLAGGGGCDKGTASLYIEYLINFCLENDVPTSRPLMELADDLERYTYSALMHKKCLICGRKADLHHAEGSMIGMGYNRKEKPQIGAMVMPLCREHHTEYHSIGGRAFDEKYHTTAVALDKRIADKYELSKKAKEETA